MLNLDNKKINIHLDGELKPSGFIATYQIDYNPDKIDAHSIEVNVSGFNEKFGPFALTGSGTDFIRVHTHLLSQPSHDVTFRLSTQGKIVSTQTYELPGNPTGNALFTSVRKAMIEEKVPAVFFGPCDSTYYPYKSQPLSPWFDHPDAKDQIVRRLKAGEIDEAQAKQLEQFVTDGFLVFENFVEDGVVDKMNAEIDDAIAKGHEGYEYGSSQRIERLHDFSPAIRDFWLSFSRSPLLKFLFGHDAGPCQTLTFVFGSQQDPHQDIIHLTPYPAGYMCGIWVALQDVVEDSGELVIYPGSHREGRVYMDGTGCAKVENDEWTEFGEKVVPRWGELASRYTPEIYRPKKGTVGIWHENLLHAGSARIDESLERRSLVIHIFAEGSVKYYDSTGIVGSIYVPEEVGT